MMLLSPFSLSLVGPMKVPTQSVVRTSPVNMKDIVLADKALEQKINAIVNAEDGRTKSAAMCSQMAAANLDRLRLEDEEGGCAPLGPPFTEPTGIGWDVSTEPKNQEDMIALAKKQNPVVGFWGARSLQTSHLVASSLSAAKRHDRDVHWLLSRQIRSTS